MSAEEKLQNFSNKFENNCAAVDSRLLDEKSLQKYDIDTKSGAISEEVARSSSKVDEEKKTKSSQYNCCTYLKQTAVLWWTERVILILVCIAIAAGFTIPIILYVIDTDQADIADSTLSMAGP